MKLLPLSSPADIELAAAWLQLQENYQWLDFGNGRQCVTPTLLRIMSQRDSHFIRIYTSEHDHDTPIGIVGLNSVDRHFRTATLWVVAGDKSFRYRGYAQLAASRFLTLAFRDLGLHSVNTWAVEHNVSVRAALRVGFRFVGRQRQCHLIDGRLCDRLLFDLLASEHREIDHPRAAARAPDSPPRAPALGSAA